MLSREEFIKEFNKWSEQSDFSSGDDKIDVVLIANREAAAKYCFDLLARELEKKDARINQLTEALARAMAGLEEYKTLVLQSDKSGGRMRLGYHAELTIEAVKVILDDQLSASAEPDRCVHGVHGNDCFRCLCLGEWPEGCEEKE